MSHPGGRRGVLQQDPEVVENATTARHGPCRAAKRVARSAYVSHISLRRRGRRKGSGGPSTVEMSTPMSVLAMLVAVRRTYVAV